MVTELLLRPKALKAGLGRKERTLKAVSGTTSQPTRYTRCVMGVGLKMEEVTQKERVSKFNLVLLANFSNHTIHSQVLPSC